MNATSRRTFLAGAAAAWPAATGWGQERAAAAPDGGRRVVPGSPYPTFSRATIFNGTVYVSGVLGQTPGTRDLVSEDFEPQCRQAMENLKASVEAAGSSMSHVLKCQCFLTDSGDFATFNKVYVTYFPSDPPARSTVIVKELVARGARIEIDCFAALP
ncbi:MAG: RidA family protein [Phycisphaerales bacterium]|nr:MAG: RidA family protein [Phycisphaerales bacterium]